MDTFTFSDPHRTLELNPSEVDRLRRTARRVIEGKESVAELLRGRPKPGRKGKLKPSVTFDGAPTGATFMRIGRTCITTWPPSPTHRAVLRRPT